MMTVPMKAEANVKQVIPFFWVRDIQKSIRFYVDDLGFLMTKDWTDGGRLRWCWLELGATAVMLQEFWQEGPNRNATEGILGQGVMICFTCDDAIAFYREIRSRGVTAKRPFVGNAMWVTEVTDPDGYHLLFESPTDVAEETEYSE